MDSKARAINTAFTQIARREDELYHRYGVFCGLSDPAIWVLYTLYEEKDTTYTQNDLVSIWFFPKQTLNYTVSGLVKNGWIQLEQLPGGRNRKAIRLTEEGERICEEKIRPLMVAEEKALTRMTSEEQELLLHLSETYFSYFEEEIKKITGE